MLDGWYCRSMANQQAANEQHENDDDIDANQGDSGATDDSQDEGISRINQKLIDFKSQYHNIKKKLKFLLYVSFIKFKSNLKILFKKFYLFFKENEFFQDALRSSQRRLLKVTRDKSFLLDRLLQYEKPDATSSESEETESSDDEGSRIEPAKKRKLETVNINSNVQKSQSYIKRKRPPTMKKQNFSQVNQFL